MIGKRKKTHKNLKIEGSHFCVNYIHSHFKICYQLGDPSPHPISTSFAHYTAVPFTKNQNKLLYSTTLAMATGFDLADAMLVNII